jgi:hypothetical protein
MRLTVKRRPVCDRLAAAGATGFGAPQSAVGSGWNEVAGALLLALEQEGPRAGRDSNGTSNVFPAAG